MTKITFIQTADPVDYAPMLAETSKTIEQYCAKNGHAYQYFIGIRRGHLPWHASYNRIEMLRDLVQQGTKGWIAYFDADAYIVNFDFDLSSYLSSRNSLAAILFHTRLPQDHEWFLINDGVFYINLDSSVACEIINKWAMRLDQISEEQFDKSTVWGQDFDDDQWMLVQTLRDSPHCQEKIEHADQRLRSFSKQYFRAYESNLNKRTSTIADNVRIVLLNVRQAG